jgi:hypothetical protein
LNAEHQLGWAFTPLIEARLGGKNITTLLSKRFEFPNLAKRMQSFAEEHHVSSTIFVADKTPAGASSIFI